MNYTRTLSAALLAAALFAQEDKTFRATVNVVVVPTTITDKSGAFVANLKPSDFRLYDNEKLQDIRVDEVYQPLSLVVVIQADAAMDPILPKVKKISSMLTAFLAGQDGELAIMAFDHRIRTMQEFTNDTDKIRTALDNIRPGSEYSVMKDAVNEATRMLRDRPKDRRKVILLISETRDKSSSGKTREILANIQFANILVYTVNVNRAVTTLAKKTPVPRPDPVPPGGRHMPAGIPNTPGTQASMGVNLGSVVPLFVEIFKDVKDIFVSNPAEVFTKYTGGREYSFVSQKDLENAIQGISEELHSQYILSYNPDNKIEGGWHDIKVTVARQESADWKVRARPGYWMAGVPE